jgi:hypothetical protein
VLPQRPSPQPRRPSTQPPPTSPQHPRPMMILPRLTRRSPPSMTMRHSDARASHLGRRPSLGSWPVRGPRSGRSASHRGRASTARWLHIDGCGSVQNRMWSGRPSLAASIEATRSRSSNRMKDSCRSGHPTTSRDGSSATRSSAPRRPDPSDPVPAASPRWVPGTGYDFGRLREAIRLNAPLQSGSIGAPRRSRSMSSGAWSDGTGGPLRASRSISASTTRSARIGDTSR